MIKGDVPQTSTTTADDFTKRVDVAIQQFAATFESAERKLSNSITNNASSQTVVKAKDDFDITTRHILGKLDELAAPYIAEPGNDKEITTALTKIDSLLAGCGRRKRAMDAKYYDYTKESASLSSFDTRHYALEKAPSRKSSVRTHSTVSQLQLQIAHLKAQLEEQEVQLELEADRKILRSRTKRQIAVLKAASESSRGSTISVEDHHSVPREPLKLENVSTAPVAVYPATVPTTLGQTFMTLSVADTVSSKRLNLPTQNAWPPVTSSLPPVTSSLPPVTPTLWEQSDYQPPFVNGPAVSRLAHGSYGANAMPYSHDHHHDHVYPISDPSNGPAVNSSANTHPGATHAPRPPEVGHLQPSFAPPMSNYEAAPSPSPWNSMLGSMKRGFDLQTITIASFSGDPLDYHRFINEFDAAFESAECPAEQHPPRTKLNKLLSYCTGKALNAVTRCRMGKQDAEAYQLARDTLYENYGRDTYVTDAFIDKLKQGGLIDTRNTQALIDISDDLVSALHVLKQCSALSPIDTKGALHAIFQRFPHPFLNRFLLAHQEKVNKGKEPTFEDFVAFVKRQADTARSPVAKLINSLRKDRPFRNTRKPEVKVHTTATTSAPNKTASSSDKGNPSTRKPRIPKCPVCEGPHHPCKCQAFRELSPEDRKKFLQQNSHCLNCTYPGHSHQECPSENRCKIDGCDALHHTLLHEAFAITPTTSSPRPATEVNSMSSIASIKDKSQPARLSTVPVKITSPNSNHVVFTNAFLDSGATSNLCTNRLLKKLGIQGDAVDCRISTALGSVECQAQYVSIAVQGINENTSIQMNEVLATDHFPNVESHVPRIENIKMYKHLSDISIPIIDTTDVDLLIGQPVLMTYPVTKTIKSSGTKVGAQFGPFGWSVCGTDETMHSKIANVSSINFVDVNASAAVYNDNFYKHCTMPTLPTPICSVCNADFPDLNSDPYEVSDSLDDEKAITIMKQSTRIVDGRFQIGLPWRSDDVKLPNNREAAVKSLHNQRRKFMRDPELFRKYNKKINEYLDRGYAQVIPEDLLPPTDRTFYLIHFHTSQKKMRIVFDASRRFENKSLNSELLSGPDLALSLISVLCRFRMYRYPWAADLAQMFSRIRTYPKDSDSLRFLWFENNDLNGKIIDFFMTSMIFGSTCSPSIAQYTLRQIVSLNGTSADEDTLNTILRNMYVDDCLRSDDNLDTAISVIHQLRELFSHYGFRLTKFVSNNPQIMSQIPESDRAPQLMDLDFENSDDERALGVVWNVANDTVEVRTQIQSKPITRREIASQIAQVYDPFGIVAPFMLPAKRLMQELTRLDLGWDTPVEGDYKARWVKWIKALPELKNLSFPRCYKPPEFEPIDVQLHNFADASNVGYAACCYFRFQDAQGNVHVAFIRGISRVVPKNAPSIPRLELTAALASVKLARTVLKDIDYKIDSVFYWTDSTAVLQCIRSKTARFHTFVHQRLLKIRALTQAEMWKHIDTKRNPSDIGSRGLMPNRWKQADPWFYGPEFLQQSDQFWTQDEGNVADDLTSSDLKNEIVSSIQCSVPQTSLQDLLEHFSSFTKLVRSTAWIIRLRAVLHWKSKGSPEDSPLKPGSSFLTVEELDYATKEIVRISQTQSFPDAFKFFNQSHSDVKNSAIPLPKSITKLMPFNSNGVLCVGGRLNRSTLPEQSRNPMILPPSHHVTNLIVRHYHETNGHCGTLHVLSLLREKFWIVKGQTSIRKVINKCVYCQCRRATPGSQYMADLPKYRLQPYQNVFHHTMVDYFGPIICRRNRTELKRYGCIFTCMCTRAVHLEVVDSLESSAFLMAFFKFTDLRGSIGHLFSDNGRNFVGAHRELGQAVRALNSKSVVSSLADRNVQWHFSPSVSPHHNGLVERLVAETKRILYALNQNAAFHDNTLSALFYGVARILNDRPITPVSNDVNDLECLTPNSILLGRLDPAMPTHVFHKADDYAKNWRFVQRKLDLFWERWLKEYLPQLQARSKWFDVKPNFEVGDIVLLLDYHTPRGTYPKAIIEQTFPDRHGIVRRVKVRTANGTYERDIRKLCHLELS